MTRSDMIWDHLLIATAAFVLGLAFQCGCTPPVTPLTDAGDGGSWLVTCAKLQAHPGFIRNADGTPYVPDCDAGAP